MTTLGKILTVFIFVFSLVFLFFAFSVNQLNKDPAGNSWYQVAKKNMTEAARKDEDLKAKDLELADLRGKLAAQNHVLKTTVDQLTKQLEDVNDSKRLEKSRADELQNKFKETQALVQATLDELNKRRAENVDLAQTLKTRESEIADLRAKVTEANNLRTKSEVAASYAARLQKLESDYAELARGYEELVQRKADKAAETGQKTPPPDDVQGEVEEVGADGLVSISIGSDAGLLRGHTLNVFRLTPKPTYLGELRIVQVTPHKAVGKLLNPEYRKVIRKGDMVANRIVNGKQ